MSPDSISRRRFLLGAGTVSLAGMATLSSLAVISGCGGDQEAAQSSPAAETTDSLADTGADPCSDLSGLTADEIETREMYDYVDQSTEPQEYCDNCEYWEPARDSEACGGCSLMAGPIHPKGWCSAWFEAT